MWHVERSQRGHVNTSDFIYSKNDQTERAIVEITYWLPTTLRLVARPF